MPVAAVSGSVTMQPNCSVSAPRSRAAQSKPLGAAFVRLITCLASEMKFRSERLKTSCESDAPASKPRLIAEAVLARSALTCLKTASVGILYFPAGTVKKSCFGPVMKLIVVDESKMIPVPEYGRLFHRPGPCFHRPVSDSTPSQPAGKVGLSAAQLAAVSSYRLTGFLIHV